MCEVLPDHHQSIDLPGSVLWLARRGQWPRVMQLVQRYCSKSRQRSDATFCSEVAGKEVLKLLNLRTQQYCGYKSQIILHLFLLNQVSKQFFCSQIGLVVHLREPRKVAAGFPLLSQDVYARDMPNHHTAFRECHLLYKVSGLSNAECSTGLMRTGVDDGGQSL
jgi:hypothetical protein